MTKTEHGGTGSVMNNLSSCPSRAASSARRGAPTIIRFLGWHGAHLFPWQHTFLPCVTDKTVSTAIQQEQGRQSGWWDSEMPSVWGEASFHSPSLKQLHNSHCLLTYLYFWKGFSCFSLSDTPCTKSHQPLLQIHPPSDCKGERIMEWTNFRVWKYKSNCPLVT